MQDRIPKVQLTDGVPVGLAVGLRPGRRGGSRQGDEGQVVQAEEAACQGSLYRSILDAHGRWRRACDRGVCGARLRY